MQKYHLIALTAAAGIATLGAQDTHRRATMGRGPGGGGDGCVVTVMVDGAANIEIRGDDASLRDVSGAQPQIRQFECSRPIPPNANVRFIPDGGRGRQEMVRQGRDGGPIMVHIEDPEGGAGEYRFRLVWGDTGDRRDQGARDQGAMDRDRDRYRGDADRRDGDYAQERDRFFQGESWRRNLFQRVREDVEHVERGTIPFTGDRARLSRTVTELNELQGKLSQGRYDERQLDDVIAALRMVVDENRMAGPDRDALSDDLRRLRDFRERHDDYGARYPRN